MGFFPWRKQKSLLPYDMFGMAQEEYDDKKAATLENVYHRSHKRAWNGKKILPMLIEKHGKPALPAAEKEAVARLFAIILWGELAAWKISLQLADRVVPMEAKMAATSQAFDEARHFYTMRDYLAALDCPRETLNPKTEKAIRLVLGTDDLAQKMVGMQLMVEPIALTIFQTVRNRRIEPVLSDLLQYYEIDEANHVAFGINYSLPWLPD